jgi:hypothetical protein
MRPVLEVCDRDWIPAYLEATSEDNSRLYLRNGFEEVGGIELPRRAKLVAHVAGAQIASTTCCPAGA